MKSNTNQNIVIYSRVSTDEQEKKFSLASQIEQGMLYARNHGLLKHDEEIDDNNIFTESESASYIKDTDCSYDFNTYLPFRPKLKKILELANQKKFKHFIVYSRDRLSRNVKEFVALMVRFKSLGITVHYAKPGEYNNFDDTKVTQLIDIVLSSVAEYEANMISDRVKTGCLKCAKTGHWPGGRSPYGYKIVGEQKKLKHLAIENSKKQDKIKTVFEYYNYYGCSYQEVANKMKAAYPQENWTKSKVETIITNYTYTGRITWDRFGGRRIPGKHKKYVHSRQMEEIQIVSDALWNHATKLREMISKNNDPKYYNTPYLLKDKLYCGICGNKMKPKNYGKNKRIVYRCPTLKNGIASELMIDKEPIENVFIHHLRQILTSTNYSGIWLTHKKFALLKRKQLEADIKELREEKNKIDELLNNIEAILPFVENEEIQFELQEKQSRLYIQKKLLKDQLKTLYPNQIYIYPTLKEFEQAIKKICTRFGNYKEKIDRVFVNLLVERVTIIPYEENLHIEIILNPPKL